MSALSTELRKEKHIFKMVSSVNWIQQKMLTPAFRYFFCILVRRDVVPLTAAQRIYILTKRTAPPPPPSS